MSSLFLPYHGSRKSLVVTRFTSPWDKARYVAVPVVNCFPGTDGCTKDQAHLPNERISIINLNKGKSVVERFLTKTAAEGFLSYTKDQVSS
jgi:hypothetical protein